jgi:hypothetical protein
MKRITRAIVVCARPRGCGWSWERVTTRRHWWSRPVTEWGGPVFEDGNRCAFRWRSDERFRDEYADCLRHLVTDRAA